MSKFYLLATCSTCKRILKELELPDSIEQQDIKTEPISAEQLDSMTELAGSYEALFSKRAQKYKTMGLKTKVLSESDYRALILEEYTFLKRPVLLFNNQIFVGNAAKTVEAAKVALAK